MSFETEPTIEILNRLLGASYTGLAQHQSHVALLDSWGIGGLARSLQARIVDEPITIATLMTRLLDLGGQPSFTLSTPNIGTTLREILDNDLEGQRQARPTLNAAAEAAAADHDATTRVLIEGILADEERHLAWLETERDLLERLGEPIYLASRLGAPPATPSA